MSEQRKFKSNHLIYLLEDDSDDAYLIRNALKDDKIISHSIMTFDSLEKLVQALTNFKPDLIIMDLNVTDSDGYNTMLTVKHSAQSVPIVVVTGVADEAMGDRLIQLGAQDYVPKSELTSSLLQRVIRFSKERHHLLQILENSANRDALTKLYSRKALDLKLEELVKHAQRYGEMFAILFIDLDNFKPINDQFGHDAGDQLLQHVANRLTLFSRSTDFVARFGGDEFVTLLPHIKNAEDAEQASQQQLNAICDDFYITDIDGQAQQVHLSASIGFALFGEHGETAVDLIKAADNAMYHNKQKESR
ncbi:two-component system response regulator [Pseudoalteromonas sp. G4]|uniref:two-component system response regulator n=1 Tax=Pseudoalteromonas sp. G4 TaxID=2992761 RepID=UPI00237E0AAC|nr:GGDEF domain-containing response regulator [Pseudoalteromonas sp. G4]MDE3274067.1 GGDEF domain-containing response regulator [Pseudoalteromonas sp. G4]